MNYNLSILQYNKEINDKINEFKQITQNIDSTATDDLRWKKSRIVSLMSALDKEIEDLNKYIVEGENEEDKKNNVLTNKIYSTIMPLMTYMWFSNQHNNTVND
jgi:septal ring factor EnvC (AmiA/AmiB activator)